MENTSGLVPVDLRILVKPDVAADKIGSVYVPEQSADKAKYATVKGLLVQSGENAFSEWGDLARKPQPGDRVLFAQFAGSEVKKGADGERYVVMNDADVLAVIEAEQ